MPVHRKPSPAIEQVPGHPGRIRGRRATAPAIRHGTLLLAAVLAGCVATPREPSAAAAAPGPRTQQEAAALARRAAREPDPSIRTRLWLDCASAAHAALDGEAAPPDAGIALADHCSTQALLDLFRRHPGGWQPGRRRIAGRELELRIEGASPMARGAYTITPAQDVPVPPGWDFRQPGFGLPLVLRADRCTDAPDCALYTPEGIYRWATAWIEHGDDVPVVRIVDPVATPSTTVGGRGMRLSFDAFSAYWKGAMASRLPRLGVYGLLGGDGIGRRAGAYLLTDYDPRKTPVVMVHGLGSHPIIWAELSGAIWADPVLRDSYQVIHVVFQTNAPLLVSTQRVRTYLDRMWELLDPEGDDPARGKMVLVGHSLGGVVARLLAVDSGRVLWDATFTVAPGQLHGAAEDVAAIQDIFLFDPYPGVCAVVMLAAPHKGSPAASGFAGRLARALVARRAPEIQALREVTLAHPEDVRDEVRDSYRFARLDSIWTLRAPQPVRRAGESLLPAPGIRYHTIAGDLHGQGGDGLVPLESALLPGARSTLVVDQGHTLYRDPVVIGRVLEILREERGLPCAGAADPGNTADAGDVARDMPD